MSKDSEGPGSDEDGTALHGCCVGGKERLSTPMLYLGTLRLRETCPTAQSRNWQGRICPGPIRGDLEPPG